MAASPPVEWITGLPRGSYFVGNVLVLMVTYSAGLGMADEFGVGPHYAWPLPDLLLTLGAMLALSVPAAVGYSLLVPTTANLGIMTEGLLVEIGSPPLDFRQGYRWTELQLRGRSLILPRGRPRSPRSLRLTLAQLERIGPRVAPG